MNEDDMKRAFYGRGSAADLIPAKPKPMPQVDVSDQLYNSCRGIMGTENEFQDISLMNVIRHVLVNAQPASWIRCSDRLPELPKGGGKAWVIGYTPARKAQSNANGARFLYWNGVDWRYGDGSRFEHSVTHWQPHLAPPTE